MRSTPNAYCAALGISAPRVEDAKSSPDANYYSLLIVALLERGEPMSLDDAAARFATAGVAPTAREALAKGAWHRVRGRRVPYRAWRSAGHPGTHPNPDRYAGQRIFVVRREDYVYLVAVRGG